MAEITLANMNRPFKQKEVVTEKVCKHCPENGPQPIANFQRIASMADGISNVCKKCIAARDKARTAKRKDTGIIE